MMVSCDDSATVLAHTLASAAVDAVGRSDLAEARRLACRALALVPDSGGYALTLGLICLSRADLETARLAFSMVVGLPTVDDLVVALNGLAAIAREQRDFARAPRWLRRALCLAPSDAHLWSNFADTVRLRQEISISLSAIRRATAIESPDSDTRFNQLLIMEAVASLPHDAATATEVRAVAALWKGSTDWRASQTVPSLLSRVGDFDGAMAAARRGACLFPADGAIALEIGRFHFARGETAAAERAYRKASACAPLLARTEGELTEVVLVSESDLAREAGSRSLLPDAQYLVRCSEAIVIKGSWATITPDGRCYLYRFTPMSESAVRYLPHVVFVAGNRVLTTISKLDASSTDGAVLLGGCDNFSHWINDWSSKLRLIVAGECTSRAVVVADTIPRYGLELLKLLGVDERRLHYQAADAARYRDLWMPSLDHRYQEVFPSHVTWLRGRLGVPTTVVGRPRRLFTSRRNARYRRIANIQDVDAVMRKFGIEEVFPDEMSLEAQLELFAQAELWVGVVGGGSASVLFCPTDCRVVEIAHRRIVLPQYDRVTGLVGQKFRRVVGEVVFRGREGPEYEFDWDFVVPVSELDQTIQEILST
jgi:tetratricopeptide (TPR) repeat protein